MINEKEFEFWKNLIKKEFDMDYHSIVHVIEPEEGIDNYCVIGYVEGFKPTNMVIRVEKEIHDNYRNLVKVQN